jgi:chemotaxis-related protein WspB
MNVLVFHIGPERYALPLAAVLRVLPAARLKALPGTPVYVAGLLDLHGEPVPVIDLARLAGWPAAALRYDTRILLIDLPVAGSLRRLGLLAERVAGVEALADTPADAGVLAAPWLGQVAAAGTNTGLLQLIVPAHLLAPDVAAALFGAPGDAP